MRLGPAARVAATATGIIAVVYVLGVIVLNLVVSARLAQQNDNRLADRLAAASHDQDVFSQSVPRTFRDAGDGDADSAPVFFWLLNARQAVTDVALSSLRHAAGYRDALVRIQGESARLRHLVDDMLWLARFDSRPPPPGDKPVDLATLAQACADRFRAVGPAITAETPAQPALINAPPEWIDQLAGVLMDNACRYAGPDGVVRVGVRASSHWRGT
jgi:signal transduction histidine kinase